MNTLLWLDCTVVDQFFWLLLRRCIRYFFADVSGRMPYGYLLGVLFLGCGYCGRPFDHRHTEAPKGFCSNTCARRGSSQPLTGSSIKRKPGRPFGSKNSKNLGSPARKSDRIRTKEPLPYDAFFDAEESNDSAPDRVRSRSFCSGSSSLKRGRSIVAAKSVKSPSSQSKKDEKEESHTHFMEVSGRDSPEIEAPAPSSSNNSSFVLPSEMESTSSKPADVQISEKEADKPSGKRHKSVAPYLSHVVRSYIMDKSDNVKSLITEKPVVSWDVSTDLLAYINDFKLSSLFEDSFRWRRCAVAVASGPNKSAYYIYGPLNYTELHFDYSPSILEGCV